jgi:LL-diaminopimelate aminotransferase
MQVLVPHFFATLSGKIAALTAAGKDIIRLDEGAPDLPPAGPIIEALYQSALKPDRHSYQPHRGIPALRQAWADHYLRVYGVQINPDNEILPLLGSKEGIFHLPQAYVNPGDVVLIPDPGYISYTRGTLFCGGEPYYFPLRPENGYLPDLDAFPPDVLRRAKLMWLNYPNTPTAATATADFFAEAVEFARRHGILLCHDAAYTQITFDGQPAPSLLAAPGAVEVAVEFNTLSKSHNMAGWRVGALLGNPEVVRNLFVLKTNADSSHFAPIMEATVVAIHGDQTWLAGRNEIYRVRRDVVIRGLSRMGIQVEPPAATLYVWSPVPQGWSAVEFVTGALEQAQVSLTPGTLFGENGEGYVRISLTAPTDRVIEAMDRLERWMTR